MTTLLKTDMRLGDVLLENEAWSQANIKHKLIMVGQGLTPNNKGSAEVIHAAMWIRSPSFTQNDIAEASGSGTVRLSKITANPHVRWRVYRSSSLFGGMGGNMKVLGRQAAAQAIALQAAIIAKRWASYTKPIPYNKKACVQVIVHSDALNEGGQARAAVYKQNAYAKDGLWAKQGFFCSHFIVACYQAAAQILGHDLSGFLFTSDAIHTSVKQLEHRLRSDSDFQYAGDYLG